MILVSDNTNTYFINGSMLDETARVNTLTSYPTVEGTSFSDHYYREPYSASFKLFASTISKPLFYSVTVDENNARVERSFSVTEVLTIIKKWFDEATRLTIVSENIESVQHVFEDMVLQQYSWSDDNLALFDPVLSFKEARTQKLRNSIVINANQYYQASYSGAISVGGATSVESGPNLGGAFFAGASGAAVGAMVGSIIPGIGTAAGALVGGAIGFFGSLFG